MIYDDLPIKTRDDLPIQTSDLPVHYSKLPEGKLITYILCIFYEYFIYIPVNHQFSWLNLSSIIIKTPFGFAFRHHAPPKKNIHQKNPFPSGKDISHYITHYISIVSHSPLVN